MRCFRYATPKKHFTFVFRIHHGAKGFGHAITGDDITRDGCSTFKVVRCTGGHLIHEHLFGNTPPEQHRNRVKQTLFIHAVAVAFRQLHGHAQCPAVRNDGYFVHRIGFGQGTSHQGMTGFVVSRIAAFFFRHDKTAALCTHNDLVFGFLEVLHVDGTTTASCREQCCLVNQIGQIGTREPRRTSCQDMSINVG